MDPMCSARKGLEVESTETGLLLEGVFRHTGFDFRGFSPAAVVRAIHGLMRTAGTGSVSALQERVLRDTDLMDRLVEALADRPVEWFADPAFFRALRKLVVPVLRTYPFVRIWVPACSTGEEVYSLAMLLVEERLHDRCQIYGTEVSEALLAVAKRGAIPLAGIEAVAARHAKGGGRGPLEAHYRPSGDYGILSDPVRQLIVFGQHSLSVDASFNEFNLIIFRDVMPRFTPPLQARVFGLFHDSLPRLGILALGKKDTMKQAADAACYRRLARGTPLFRRME